MERIASYDPVVDVDCRMLILGTVPSVESLRAGFYYAHPRNALWRILADAFDCPLPGSIQQKKELLIGHHIAMWDVLHSCVRQGSLDSAIRTPEPNDFNDFFARFPKIERVFFNGATAEKLFMRFCESALVGRAWVRLPSTSPAYTLSYEKKFEIWRKELFKYDDKAFGDPTEKTIW